MDYVWVYETFAAWRRLDDSENQQIEQMWLQDINGTIWSNTFQGNVRIDTSGMILSQGLHSYAIARVNPLYQKFAGPYNQFIC